MERLPDSHIPPSNVDETDGVYRDERPSHQQGHSRLPLLHQVIILHLLVARLHQAARLSLVGDRVLSQTHLNMPSLTGPEHGLLLYHYPPFPLHPPLHPHPRAIQERQRLELADDDARDSVSPIFTMPNPKGTLLASERVEREFGLYTPQLSTIVPPAASDDTSKEVNGILKVWHLSRAIPMSLISPLAGQLDGQ